MYRGGSLSKKPQNKTNLNYKIIILKYYYSSFIIFKELGTHLSLISFIFINRERESKGFISILLT